MINNFLSNKWNLIGLSAISYFIIGYMFKIMGFTLGQLFLAYVLMYIGNFAAYLYGMSKGIVFATTTRPKFIQELDKINELMREENNTTSNKKCKKKTKKSNKDKGCSSGGCNKC
jgi:hypothetical protein